MLATEHQDWCRYYRDAGWKYAPQRNDKRRRHNKLLPYEEISCRDDFVRAAQRSLAGTLVNLRGLGYRSVPKSAVELAQRVYQAVVLPDDPAAETPPSGAAQRG
jgi:hypothetical protein